MLGAACGDVSELTEGFVGLTTNEPLSVCPIGSKPHRCGDTLWCRDTTSTCLCLIIDSNNTQWQRWNGQTALRPFQQRFGKSSFRPFPLPPTFG